MQMPDLQQTTLPLRDIRLPAEPGFWPLAPGWWVLAALALLLLIWMTVKWLGYRRRKHRWLAINEQLSELEFNHQTQPNKQRLLQELSVFLRRFVKHQLHDRQAVTAQGTAWIDSLNQWLPGEPFNAFAEVLNHGVYQADCEFDEQRLLELVRQLIKTQVLKPAKRVTGGGGQHV
jgi:hypothetical protein